MTAAVDTAPAVDGEVEGLPVSVPLPEDSDPVGEGVFVPVRVVGAGSVMTEGWEVVGPPLVPVTVVGAGSVMTEGLEVPAGLEGGRRVNVGTWAEVSSEAVGWTGLDKSPEERRPDGRPEDL